MGHLTQIVWNGQIVLAWLEKHQAKIEETDHMAPWDQVVAMVDHTGNMPQLVNDALSARRRVMG